MVEFESIEGAVHTVGFKGYATVRGVQVVIGFANPQCVRWGERKGREKQRSAHDDDADGDDAGVQSLFAASEHDDVYAVPDDARLRDAASNESNEFDESNVPNATSITTLIVPSGFTNGPIGRHSCTALFLLLLFRTALKAR